MSLRRNNLINFYLNSFNGIGELNIMKTVLVTGAKGFIGKNLIVRLQELNNIKIKSFDKEEDMDTLKKFLGEADFIFHLAGVNRPEKVEEFEKVNVGLTKNIINLLEEMDKKIPIVITSSIKYSLHSLKLCNYAILKFISLKRNTRRNINMGNNQYDPFLG